MGREVQKLNVSDVCVYAKESEEHKKCTGMFLGNLCTCWCHDDPLELLREDWK